MITGRFQAIILSLVLALMLGLQTVPHVSSAVGGSVIGLGVTGQYPMELVAEGDVGHLEGYIRIINDGGSVMGYYNVSFEGQIAGLDGWNVTLNPQIFALEPERSQKVNVVIEFPEVIGEFTCGIRVSAYSHQPGGVGAGIAEILVPVTVRLTSLSIIVQTTGQGTVTYINRPEIFTSQNPAIIDSSPGARCIIVITQISHPCKITVENISSLPAEVTSPSDRFKVVGNYLKITANTTISLNAVLKVYYDPEQLIREKLDAAALKLYRWDGEWKPFESPVNTTDNSISATITGFSYWALMIRLQEPFYTQWWFWLPVVAAIVSAAVLLRRMKR